MNEVKAEDLRLIYHSQPLSSYLHNPLFTAGDGEPVWAGDRVEFDTDDEAFPSSGTVCNYDGLKISCFNVLLNKWQYYGVLLQLENRIVKDSEGRPMYMDLSDPTGR